MMPPMSQVRARLWAPVSVLDASVDRVDKACTGQTRPKTSSRKTLCLACNNYWSGRIGCPVDRRPQSELGHCRRPL